MDRPADCGGIKALTSLISQVELSRLAGTTRQVVSKAVRVGHIKVNRKRKVIFDHDLTQLWFQKQVAKNAEAPLQGKSEPKKGDGKPVETLVNLQRDKIIEEIGKIKADKKLKELQLQQRRGDLIEKDTIAAVLFQYMDALNINMLDVPEMIVDTIMDKVNAGASRGDIIKVMRDKNQKAIVNTKKQVKERLK